MKTERPLITVPITGNYFSKFPQLILSGEMGEISLPFVCVRTRGHRASKIPYRQGSLISSHPTHPNRKWLEFLRIYPGETRRCEPWRLRWAA